ncbi:MAG: type IV pilin N-terminal domain-containing protein [archaeon]|nr:MAG: type IV pilin N-terminal domain-containing protein [archaeon]
MNIRNNSDRKAISPVLATVILIAITLVAAVAIAGFVFGLFGSFTNTAQVSASNVSCDAASGRCTVGLLNTGTSNTSTTGSCSETYSGATQTSNNSTQAVVTAGAGAVSFTCSFAWVPGTSGSQVTGSISLTNGGNVLFSGSFS